jgi:hypothetical protein
MEKMARDFTAQVPASKGKTEMHRLLEGQMGSYRTFPPYLSCYAIIGSVSKVEMD